MSTSALLPAPTARLASLQLPQLQLPAWAMPPAQPQPPLTEHITLLPGHTASCDGDSVLPLGTAQTATAQCTHVLQEVVWEPLAGGKSLSALSSSQKPLCRSAPTLFLPSAHKKAVETHENTFLQRLPLHGLKPPRTSWMFKDLHGLTLKGPDTSWDQFNSRLYHQIMMSLCTQCAKQP